MAPLTRFTLSATVILLFVSLCQAKLIFESPTALEGLTLNAYHFLFIGNGSRLNFTSVRVIASDPLHACHWDQIKNKDLFENNLVIVGKGTVVVSLYVVIAVNRH